jgi:uncharacterized membrane protein
LVEPEQTLAEPAIEQLGIGLTVTTAVPLPAAVQFTSVTDAIE